MKFLPQWTRRVAMDDSGCKTEWGKHRPALIQAVPKTRDAVSHIMVPHEAGAPVEGEILVLEDTLSVEEARLSCQRERPPRW